MRLALYLLLSCVLAAAAYGQADERVGVQTVSVGGGAALALGGAGVGSPEAWANLNPAALATARGRARLYADQGFGLAELRTGALDLSYPFAFATLGVGAQTLGFDDFRVSNLSVTAARAFRLGTRRTFDAGVSVVVHHAQVEGYGSGVAVAFDAGLRVELLPELDAGFSGRNLTGAQIAGKEPVPQVLTVGLAYAPSDRFRVLLDAVEDTRFPTSVRGGVEVWVVDALALRTGVGTEPTLFSAGAGLRLGTLRADLAATRHDVLGWTPAVELGVAW